MSKYGLRLRVKPSEQKKPQTKPPRPSLLGFNNDDEDDVEREISRQASKNKALRYIEEQHKKALEEDPSAFDYDGVYDEMKEKSVCPLVHDRQERKPKYIQQLVEKAKQREREHEIIYERKLAKERSKDDHLYVDKDKFVTRAYREKLAEQAKWLEEERLHELQEEREDVTKKSDISDFYFNLSKNVAFGAREAELEKQEKSKGVNSSEVPLFTKSSIKSSRVINADEGETPRPSSLPSKDRSEAEVVQPALDASKQEKEATEQPATEQPIRDHHKRNADAVAAAKERFLARKKATEQSTKLTLSLRCDYSFGLLANFLL